MLACAIALVSVGVCGAEEKAHLLIQKALLTNRPFAGKDLPIRYRIFNVGGRCPSFPVCPLQACPPRKLIRMEMTRRWAQPTREGWPAEGGSHN